MSDRRLLARREVLQTAALGILVGPVHAAPPGFMFRELDSGGLQLLEGGNPVFTYNQGMQLAPGVDEQYRRSGYLYPVWTPRGTSVAGDFQKDHPMHRGVYFGWREVQLAVGGPVYDHWGLRGIRTKWLRWVEKTAKPDQAVLEAENAWTVDSDGRQPIHERLRYVVEPAKGNRRVIHVTGTFEARDQPVTIRGAQEEQKGYSGFSFRFPFFAPPREGVRIFTDKGELQPDEENHVPHEWACLEASFKGMRAGVRVEPALANPGAPHEWCLRKYGVLSPCFPGVRTFQLDPGKPLVLRYDVTVYDVVSNTTGGNDVRE
jgi:hypothetical protein